MNLEVVEKCLAFCQGLVNSNHQFTLKLSLGKDNFEFQNKELVKSSCTRKKKSPSQLRREQKRRDNRKAAQSGNATVEVAVKALSDSFKCEQCEMKFNSEKGLKIHVGKTHKSIGLQTPEKERTSDSLVELSLKKSPILGSREELCEVSPEKSEEVPNPQKKVEKPEPKIDCGFCGEKWGPATKSTEYMDKEDKMVNGGEDEWWTLCDVCWSDFYNTPASERYLTT